MNERTLNIEGMSCEHCVQAVKKALSKLKLNVKGVKVGSAEIEYDENMVTENDLKNAVEQAGYKLVQIRSGM